MSACVGLGARVIAAERLVAPDRFQGEQIGLDHHE